MRKISEWMEHVIARAGRRAAHQVGGDRVSDALSQVELWATTACRYQAGPRLSSRAGWGKRRPSIRRRAWRNDLSTTRDCIIPVGDLNIAFYIG